MTLTELADRVERLTGRDLEINKLIPVVLGYSWNGALSSANPDGRWQKSPLGPFLKDDDFTGSIDAAMTLGDPDAEISISTLYGVARVEYPLNFADHEPYRGEHVGGLIAPANLRCDSSSNRRQGPRLHGGLHHRTRSQ